MPSINVDSDYTNHPKTVNLRALIGHGSDVLPVNLWCHCAKYHWRDGVLKNYSIPEIERVIGWWGESGKAVAALVQSGFLTNTRKGYKAKNWERYQGHISAYKERAQNAALIRHGKVSGRRKRLETQQLSIDATSNASSTRQAVLRPCNAMQCTVGEGAGEGESPVREFYDAAYAAFDFPPPAVVNPQVWNNCVRLCKENRTRAQLTGIVEAVKAGQINFPPIESPAQLTDPLKWDRYLTVAKKGKHGEIQNPGANPSRNLGTFNTGKADYSTAPNIR